MFISAARLIASQIHYPSIWSLGSATLCAAAVAQIGYRLFTEVREKKGNLSAEWTQREVARMTFFSLCAFNIVPYTAVFGAATFLLHSYFSFFEEEHYDLSYLIIDYSLQALYFGKRVGEQIVEYTKSTPPFFSLKEKETWVMVAAIVTIFAFIQIHRATVCV
jgi:hypothetical protein